MNYELAKELKDAGFPFLESALQQEYCYYCRRKSVDIDGKWFYIPTLEELIEACGERFSVLARDINGFTASYSEPNHQFSLEDPNFEYLYWKGSGKTPTETVANLYLALQSRKE